VNRVDNIAADKEYRECLRRIAAYEKEREFCLHDYGHFLDVARLACIISMEEGLSLPKPLIYAAALLHDIGRADEYESGRPHDEMSVKRAGPILERSGFSPDEAGLIVDAIGQHHDKAKEKSSLGELLYRADKKSRPCYICNAYEKCKWSSEKKNRNVM